VIGDFFSNGYKDSTGMHAILFSINADHKKITELVKVPKFDTKLAGLNNSCE